MNIIKSSLGGLALILLGELVGMNHASAQMETEPAPAPIHDTSIINTKQSLVDAAGANPSVTGNFDSETGTFSVEGLGEGTNNITLSPDVIQALETSQGTASGSSTNGSNTGESVTGGSGSSDSGSGDSSSADSSSGGSGGSSLPSNITVNDLAKLIQTDLQESVDNLVAAESIDNQPRRFSRRRSANQNCNCVIGANGERKSFAQLQDEVELKTKQAENFVREITKLDPQNNIW